ncbi:PREDICTED: F-box protein DOR-like isoform X1 [Camelina sativa]|uniref:F-box protein DOR-like isoform X1 n=2 Tax=Camelina sativa TaxID=90675 RepID=A0ABM1Q8C5_CAMSA|nr:PREDICTED: F-box protein DOR-like isoform X1 [Camelina sativa]
MNRQIHGTVSSSKPIALIPLSDSNSEPASGSEIRVYTRKRKLKQEPLEIPPGKGINAHKQLCGLPYDIQDFAYKKNNGSPSSNMNSRWQNVSEARQATLQRHSTNADENSEPIPNDLYIEIFLRLPVKSIATCRCVSKLWASLLGLPYFTELYFTRSSARPRILFTCRKDSELCFFSTPQPLNPDESSSLLAASYHMKIPFNDNYNIISPIGGLVFLRYGHIFEGRKTPELLSVIWNPSTRQSLALPKPNTRKRICLQSYFGYDPTEKQYKVLSMSVEGGIYKEHQVLTLGTEKLSWRMIECCIPHINGFKGICINGVLYYPAMADICSGMRMIVCFHVRSEKFSFIKILEPFIRLLCPTATLISYNGKLASLVWNYHKGKGFEMWVLGDPGKNEWSKHIYGLPPLWQNVLAKDMLMFAGVTGTNEVVLSLRYPSDSLSQPFYVLYYNLERKTIRRVEIQGMKPTNGCRNYIFLDYVEDVKLIQAF